MERFCGTIQSLLSVHLGSNCGTDIDAGRFFLGIRGKIENVQDGAPSSSEVSWTFLLTDARFRPGGICVARLFVKLGHLNAIVAGEMEEEGVFVVELGLGTFLEGHFVTIITIGRREASYTSWYRM